MLLDQLTRTLEKLALEPDEQIAYVAHLGSRGSLDELALELDDVLPAALSRPELLSKGQVVSLRDLDQRLDAISGPGKTDLWEERALWSSVEWSGVRAQARHALHAIRSGRLADR